MQVMLFYGLNEKPGKLARSQSFIDFFKRKKTVRRNSFSGKIRYKERPKPKKEISPDIVLHIMTFINNEKKVFDFSKLSKYYYNLLSFDRHKIKFRPTKDDLLLHAHKKCEICEKIHSDYLGTYYRYIYRKVPRSQWEHIPSFLETRMIVELLDPLPRTPMLVENIQRRNMYEYHEEKMKKSKKKT